MNVSLLSNQNPLQVKELTSNYLQCKECIDHTQRMCHRCGGGYCLTHNEGSNLVACDCKKSQSCCAGCYPRTTC